MCDLHSINSASSAFSTVLAIRNMMGQVCDSSSCLSHCTSYAMQFRVAIPAAHVVIDDHKRPRDRRDLKENRNRNRQLRPHSF